MRLIHTWRLGKCHGEPRKDEDTCVVAKMRTSLATLKTVLFTLEIFTEESAALVFPKIAPLWGPGMRR